MTKAAPRVVLVSLLVVASLCATRRATSQETPSPNAGQPQTVRDSLPFRRGQWGAVFAIDNGTVGLGVLWFRSTRKAWLLDAAVGASWSENESDVLGDYDSQHFSVEIRAGPRRYRPIAAGSAAYVGTGLTGAYFWTVNGEIHRETLETGAYGELGALYFVTRRLSLGAQVELAATFSTTRQNASVSTAASRDRRVSVGTGPVRIVGALYF